MHPLFGLGGDGPVKGEAGIKDGYGFVANLDFFWIDNGVALGESDVLLMDGQTVKSGAVEGGEALELVQRVCLFKGFRQN